jgi:hypothetical protein
MQGMRRSLFLLVVGLAAAAMPARAAADPVPLDVLLRRASEYVFRFVAEFSTVVCEETYMQEASSPMPTLIVSGVGRAGLAATMGSLRRRQLKSDFLVVNAAGDNVWHPFRDVYEVDGVTVRDREQRLTKLFINPTKSTQAQAKQIADESSRYNLGNLERTINNPVFPFLFLYADNQKRFRFAYTASTAPVEEGVRVVAFTEDSRPTLIQGPPGQAMPAHGRFWIEEATGRIVKSEILVTRVDITASLTIMFGVDERLGVSVPLEMRESYNFRNGNIRATAKYGRFRRFSVDATEDIGEPVAEEPATLAPPK